MRIFRKEESFFDLFEDHAKKTVEGCKLFVDMAQGVLPAGDACPHIKAIENDCDQITHTVKDRLHRSFITPLDRNEIYRLISKLDDVMDFVEASANCITLYEVNPKNKDLHLLARALHASAQRLAEALSGMRNLKHPEVVVEKCIEINRLENEADVQLSGALARLLSEEKDPITVIKWKEIFEMLETATDRCEDVANVIEGVVLENS